MGTSDPFHCCTGSTQRSVTEEPFLDAEDEAALAMSRAHYARALRSIPLHPRHRHVENANCVYEDIMIVMGGFNVSEQELEIR